MIDEDEQHHHRAGIDDDLHRGDEFGAQQQIDQRQRSHHHDQRQRAVDGMLLHQEVDRTSYTQRREDEEQNKSKHFGRAGLQTGVNSISMSLGWR